MNDKQHNPWHCSDVGISRESEDFGCTAKSSLISECSVTTSYAGRPDIFEHNETSGFHNYSGCRDQVLSPIDDNKDWVESYDYLAIVSTGSKLVNKVRSEFNESAAVY
jgi:hypothetical protein